MGASISKKSSCNSCENPSVAIDASNDILDYDVIRKDLHTLMDSRPDHDDGSLAPILIRLAWHSSGTYDAATKTGGSNNGGMGGATMRFGKEAGDPENTGLDKARAFLDPLLQKYRGLTYSDLWILAAYVAIEHTEGPHIPFVPGRSDAMDGTRCPFGDGTVNPNKSRLPAADLGVNPEAPTGCPLGDVAAMALKEKPTIDGMRQTFYRMGLNDREVVALMCGGHVYGRCHRENTGYAGAWVEEPTKFSNEYAADMWGDRWVEVTHESKECPDDEVRPVAGKRQYVSLGPPEALERIEGAKAEDYPPGVYTVSEGEEWINVRAGPDTKSDVIANLKEGKPYVLVSVQQFGTAVRGRVDCGGWVSVIGSGGYPLMQREEGSTAAPAPGTYTVKADTGSFLFNFADEPQESAKALEKGTQFTVTEGTVWSEGRAMGKASVDGVGAGWVLIADNKQEMNGTEGGAICDRQEEGFLFSEGVEPMKEEPIKQMMLIADMVLLWDPTWRHWLEYYADDEQGEGRLKEDFGKAFKRLTELGFHPSADKDALATEGQPPVEALPNVTSGGGPMTPRCPFAKI